jgi:NADPH oxidase 2
VLMSSFVVVFILLHLMVYAFGFLNYSMKDNLTQARATFGITYPIARAAALTLHVDVALILLRTLYHFRLFADISL